MDSSKWALAATVGVAVPVAVIYAASRRRALKRGQEPHFSSVPMERWTASHVSQWLQKWGVTANGIKAIRSNDIDGQVLTSITDDNLKEAGMVKLKDRLLFFKALRTACGDGEEAAVQRAQKEAVSPSPISRAASAATSPAEHGSQTPTSPSASEEIEYEVLSVCQNIQSTIQSQEYLEAAPQAKLKVLEGLNKRLLSLAPKLQELPEVILRSLIPLVTSAKDLITHAQILANRSSEAELRCNPMHAPPAEGRTTVLHPDERTHDSASIAAMVQPIYDILGKYTTLLSSPELGQAAPAQKMALLRTVAEEMVKIVSLTNQLPVEARSLVMERSAPIGEMLEELAVSIEGRSQASAEQAGRGSGQIKAANRLGRTEEEPNSTATATLVEQLKAIHDLAREMTMSSETGYDEQMAFVDTAMKEVARIDRQARQLTNPSDVALVTQLATKIGELIAQMKALVTARHRIAPRAPVRGDTPGPGRDTAIGQVQEKDVITMESLAEVLRRILRQMQAPEFLQAPPAVRTEALANMEESLRDVEETIRSLPPRQLEVASGLYSRVQQLLAAMKDATLLQQEQEQEQEPKRRQPLSAKSTPAPPSSHGPWSDAMHASDAARTEGGTRAAARTVMPDAAESGARLMHNMLGEVEEIFALVGSQQFMRASPEMQHKACNTVLDRIRSLRSDITRIPEENRGSMLSVLNSLEEHLSNWANVAGEVIASQQGQEAVAERGGQMDSCAPGERSPASAKPSGSEARDRKGGRGVDPEAFRAVLGGLDQLVEIMCSGEFNGTPIEVQREIATSMLRRLSGIQEQLPSFSEEQRVEIMERVQFIAETLQAIVDAPSSSEGDAEGVATADADEPNYTQWQVAELTDIKSRVLELNSFISSTAFEQIPKEMRVAWTATAIKDLIELRRRATAIGGSAGTTFAAAIGKIVQQLQSEPLEDEEVEVEVGNDDEAKSATEGGRQMASTRCSPSPGGNVQQAAAAVSEDETESVSAARKWQKDMDEGTAGLVATLRAILESLESSTFTSPLQLVPFMSIIEKTLSSADEEGLAWRESREVVDLASSLLQRVQEMQRELESAQGEKPSSRIAMIVAAAKRKFLERPPRSAEELMPFVGLLRELHSIGDELTGSEVEELTELQDLVVQCNEKMVKNPAESLLASSGDQVSRILSEIETRLLDESISSEMVKEYEGLLSTIEELGEFPPAVQAVISRVRRQINALTASHASGAADAVEAQVPLPDREEIDVGDAECIDEDGDADDGIAETEGAAAVEDQVADKPPLTALVTHEVPVDESTGERVPGGTGNALAFIRRFEERLAQNDTDFVAQSSLFDIQCISRILNYLDLSPTVAGVPQLKQHVDDVRRNFARLLEAFQGSKDQEPPMPGCKLPITGFALELDDGTQLRQLTIFSEAEPDPYTVNDGFVKDLLAPSNATAVTMPESEVAQWRGRSVAVLLYVPNYNGNSNVNKTALTELVLLHEALTLQHGFDVLCVADAAANAEALGEIVALAMESQPLRLFVFSYTPAPPSAAPAPHAVTFRDGTSLLYSKILQMAATVERVVLVHCMPLTMAVATAFRGEAGPLMCTNITATASSELLKARCSLFDTAIAPAVLELLLSDNHRMMCPEDVINQVVASVANEAITFGGTVKSPSTGMAFFAPRDMLYDEVEA